MAPTGNNKLKRLIAQATPGAPILVQDLARLDIATDLAGYYADSGWLNRLARGVYTLAGHNLERDASIVALEREVPGLHVGGKTALDWHGFRHYVTQREVIRLYGWTGLRLPLWFTSRFPSEYHRKRLFNEHPGQMLSVERFEGREKAPLVSMPERALLELLSEVAVRQSLQEARELMETMFTLRADVLTNLLKHCRSVKTVRLCLNLARELNLAWYKKLDPSRLPTGSDQPWVARSRDGVLVLEP